MTQQSPPGRDNANLDFLRAVAVLLVLANHVLEVIANHYGGTFHPLDWRLGRLGVLLFFVHTSLVLMASLERLQRGGEARLFSAFMVRRLFRIYPLAIACVLVAVAIRVPMILGEPYVAPTARRVASNVLLLLNLTYDKPVISPLWSLPLEVQMYLLLPAVFLFIGPSRSIGRAFALLALGVVAGLAQPFAGTPFLVAAFAPCFMAGIVAYALTGRVRRQLPAWAWPVAVLGLVGAYAGGLRYVEEVHPLAIGWVVCLALGLMIPAFRELRLPAIARPSLLVARYSYGIYLFHIPILWLAFDRIPGLPMPARWALFVAAMVAVPVAGYHWLEEPLIRIGGRVAGRLSRRSAARPAAAPVAAPAASPVAIPGAEPAAERV